MAPAELDRVSVLLSTSLFEELSPAELEQLAGSASVRSPVHQNVASAA